MPKPPTDVAREGGATFGPLWDSRRAIGPKPVRLSFAWNASRAGYEVVATGDEDAVLVAHPTLTGYTLTTTPASPAVRLAKVGGAARLV